MNHNHELECHHPEVKYCAHCNVTYCPKCEKTWQEPWWVYNVPNIPWVYSETTCATSADSPKDTFVCQHS